jgi:hypothetical protein
VSVLQFIASLVHALAWPAALVVLLLLFRAPITRLIDRIKKFGVTIGNTKAWADTRAVVAEAKSTAEIVPGTAPDGSEFLAHGDTAEPPPPLIAVPPQTSPPVAKMVQGFDQLTILVRDLLKPHGAEVDSVTDWHRLALIAYDAKLVKMDTALALQGLEVLNDLAMSRADAVTDEEADEFLNMANATLFAVRQNVAAANG